jgi:hypothetical protein
MLEGWVEPQHTHWVVRGVRTGIEKAARVVAAAAAAAAAVAEDVGVDS